MYIVQARASRALRCMCQNPAMIPHARCTSSHRQSEQARQYILHHHTPLTCHIIYTIPTASITCQNKPHSRPHSLRNHPCYQPTGTTRLPLQPPNAMAYPVLSLNPQTGAIAVHSPPPSRNSQKAGHLFRAQSPSRTRIPHGHPFPGPPTPPPLLLPTSP